MNLMARAERDERMRKEGAREALEAFAVDLESREWHPELKKFVPFLCRLLRDRAEGKQ